MTVSTQVSNLKINKLTKNQYESIENPSSTELYFVIDEGGGEGGTVDQTYDPASTNAQSGTAIAGAGFQEVSNLTTTLSSSSTNIQYPGAKAVYDAYSGYQTIQSIQNLSSGNISLDKTNSIYLVPVSGNITFTFDTTNLSLGNNEVFTFELCVLMPSTVYTLSFPASLTWQDSEVPDVSSTGTYYFVFRTIDGGTSWIGNLQGRW